MAEDEFIYYKNKCEQLYATNHNKKIASEIIGVFFKMLKDYLTEDEIRAALSNKKVNGYLDIIRGK